VVAAATALADDRRSSHIEKYSSSQSQPADAPMDVADETTDGSDGGDAFMQQIPPCIVSIIKQRINKEKLQLQHTFYR